MTIVQSAETSARRCQAEPHCAGAQLEGEHCLEHLTPQELEAVIARLCAGEPLDARDTTVSAERLQALLDPLRQMERPVLSTADFGGATFSGDADFRAIVFSGDADFREATFSGDADFVRTTFGGAARFDAASFVGDAFFGRATFGGNADFGAASFGAAAFFVGATFSGVAVFVEGLFGGHAFFIGATFNGAARFGTATFSGNGDFFWATFGAAAFFVEATFSRAAVFVESAFSHDARFVGTTFTGNAEFGGATLSGSADFEGTTFHRVANFSAAIFEQASQLGPLVVGERLALDKCVFTQRVTIEAAAIVISAGATKFALGALLRIRWAEIALDDADFGRPSTLSAATTWHINNDLSRACLLDSRHVELEPRPRLMTLHGAQVGELSLSSVDLRACRFFGAHGLESLRIEASCQWPRTPTAGRYGARETIAEEHAWHGWSEPSTQSPHWLEGRGGTEGLRATQIAALYRALRKAREESKDQPGAGDLYYGEMEMRRHGSAHDEQFSASHNGDSPRHPLGMRGDRAILCAYWLLSGYGLRPARALAALALTLLFGAALLCWFGFHEPRSYGRSVLFAIHSSLNVFRPPQTGLSAGGEMVQIYLRLLGPLLFGLALLAVRARVKR